MTIPKRFDEVLEEQLLEQRQAGLLGDLGAIGATALAVGELGLNPVADAATQLVKIIIKRNNNNKLLNSNKHKHHNSR